MYLCVYVYLSVCINLIIICHKDRAFLSVKSSPLFIPNVNSHRTTTEVKEIVAKQERKASTMSAKQLTATAQDEVKLRAETEKIALQILALNKAPMVPVQEVC